MYKKGDKIKFILESEGSQNVPYAYDYDKSKDLCRNLGIHVAKTLPLKRDKNKPINEGIVAMDSDGINTLITYADEDNYIGSLFFENRVLELVKATERTLYPIF